MSARYDREIADLAHQLRQKAREHQHIIAAIDTDDTTYRYDDDDESRAVDEKLAAEQALYDAIDRAGQR